MTVTFHLVAPDPDFLYKRSLFAEVVPAGTPPREAGTHHTPPLPATGPYLITSYRKNHSLTLGRNPVLPRMVEGGAAGRLSGPDRGRDRRHAGRGGRRRDPRQGGRLQHRPVGNTPFPGPACRDRDQLREPGAHEPAAGHDLSLPQHPARAVRPARRAQGAELRRGSGRGGQRSRRPRRRAGDVPDPPAVLPGLPALLPLHRRHRRPKERGRRRISPRRAPSSPAPARAA